MHHRFVPAIILALAVAIATSSCKGSPARANHGASTAEASTAEAGAAARSYDRPGYVTAVVDNRLWVFRTGSSEYADFQKHGEPTVRSVKIGVGPNGMTVKAPDMATIDGWLAAK